MTKERSCGNHIIHSFEKYSYKAKETATFSVVETNLYIFYDVQTSSSPTDGKRQPRSTVIVVISPKKVSLK